MSDPQPSHDGGWHLGLPAGWPRVAASLTVVTVMTALLAYLVIVGVRSHESSWEMLRRNYDILHEQRSDAMRILDRMDAREDRMERTLIAIWQALSQRSAPPKP